MAPAADLIAIADVEGNRAHSLIQLGRLDEAVTGMDAALETVNAFAVSRGVNVDRLVGGLLRERADVLAELGRREEAFAAYDEVIDRYLEADEPAVRAEACFALEGKRRTLENLGRTTETEQTTEILLEHFADAEEEEAVRRIVAAALANRAYHLSVAKDYRGAIALADEVIDRYSTSDDPVVRGMVARAMANKGYSLARLGRFRAALRNAHALHEHVGPTPEPEVLPLVTRNRLTRLGFRIRYGRRRAR